jgi:hypothetical protein
MIHHAKIRFVSLVLFFAFCQVSGTMCAVPDLSLADDVAKLAEDMSHMTCPMDGTIMCPPSANSSPERHLKHPAASDLNQTPVLPVSVATVTVTSISEPWSWGSASSIVPISIASSSVLRI